MEAGVCTSAPGRDVNMYASMPVGGSASLESSVRGGMAARAAPSAHDLPQYAPHAQQGHVLPPYLPSPSPRQSTVGGATERFLAFDEFVGASGSDRARVGERRQEVQGARERERERRKSAEALEGLTLTRAKSLERQRVRATSRELVRARCVEMFRCRWIACPGCRLCVLGGAYVFHHTIKMRHANTHTHTRARAYTHTHTHTSMTMNRESLAVQQQHQQQQQQQQQRVLLQPSREAGWDRGQREFLGGSRAQQVCKWNSACQHTLPLPLAVEEEVTIQSSACTPLRMEGKNTDSEAEL